MTPTPDIVTRLRNRAFRLAARDFNGDGAKLAKEAADLIEALRAENERLKGEHLEGLLTDFASKQTRLGPEFERALHANIEGLYDNDQ